MKAKQMGEGVRVASVTEVKRKDGAAGVRVDYAFKDISKLKIETGAPKEPTLGAGGEAGMENPQKKGKPMTFAFVPGTPARLTITMPPEENSAPAEPADRATEPNAPAQIGGQDQPSEEPKNQEMDGMMKSMLKDFRLTLRIKVDGEIQKSNASYVQVGGTNHKKQYVTLYSVDFGKIFGDPELFAKYAGKLGELGMLGDSPDAKNALMGLPGIQVETGKTVEIEFQ